MYVSPIKDNVTYFASHKPQSQGGIPTAFQQGSLFTKDRIIIIIVTRNYIDVINIHQYFKDALREHLRCRDVRTYNKVVGQGEIQL